METLGKKTSTPMNFAAAAGKAPATPPASSASQGPSGTSKNGSNSAGNQSPASGSQSPAPASAPASARTGTDKASAAGSATSDGLDWIIGMNVKVVTQADEVYEGQVYAYDTVMNCLALHITLVVNQHTCFALLVALLLCLFVSTGGDAPSSICIVQ
jgi:hypothetical protein